MSDANVKCEIHDVRVLFAQEILRDFLVKLNY